MCYNEQSERKVIKGEIWSLISEKDFYKKQWRGKKLWLFEMEMFFRKTAVTGRWIFMWKMAELFPVRRKYLIKKKLTLRAWRFCRDLWIFTAMVLWDMIFQMQMPPALKKSSSMRKHMELLPIVLHQWHFRWNSWSGFLLPRQKWSRMTAVPGSWAWTWRDRFWILRKRGHM